VIGVRHARLDLSDPSGTDGYLELQRWYLGCAFSPTVNANWDAALGYQDEATFQRSERGSLFVELGPRYRTLHFALDWLTGVEVLTLGEALAQAGKTADVLVSLYPGDPTARSRQTTLAARFAELPEFGVWRPDTYRATFNLVEI